MTRGQIDQATKSGKSARRHLPLAAGLRIIGRTFAYRLKMREANNLGVTISMMLAFALPWHEVVYRGGFALLLNMYVYLINDYCDVQLDLAATARDRRPAQLIAKHPGATRGALLALGALLLAGALCHSWLLLAVFLSNSVVVYSYSAWLKRVPFVDVALMALAGATMTMTGIPALGGHDTPQALLGWKLLGLLGLLSAAYEVIQLIRDEPDDRRQGVRSTAVLLGAPRAVWVFRAILLAAALYCTLVLGSLVGLVLLLGLLLPLSSERASRSWNQTRALFGLTWVVLLAQIFFGQLR